MESKKANYYYRLRRVREACLESISGEDLRRLVDLTEPICQKIDEENASMVLFDTSGIEAWVTENNPQYANRIIRL